MYMEKAFIYIHMKSLLYLTKLKEEEEEEN
jgi:hypothetical protein